MTVSRASSVTMLASADRLLSVAGSAGSDSSDRGRSSSRHWAAVCSFLQRSRSGVAAPEAPAAAGGTGEGAAGAGEAWC